MMSRHQSLPYVGFVETHERPEGARERRVGVYVKLVLCVLKHFSVKGVMCLNGILYKSPLLIRPT